MKIAKTMLLLPFAAIALAGCDMATEMAGDAIRDEVRAQFIQQCEQVAADSGIASVNVTPACECSADAFAEDASDGQLQIDQARIEEVLKTCVQGQPADPAAQPAEATNG